MSIIKIMNVIIAINFIITINAIIAINVIIANDTIIVISVIIAILNIILTIIINIIMVRAVILIRKKSNNRMHVLVSEKTAAHLPVCQINPMRSIHSTLKKYLTEIFGAEIPAHKVIRDIWRGKKNNEMMFPAARDAFPRA